MPGLQSLLKVVVGSALVWPSCLAMATEAAQPPANAFPPEQDVVRAGRQSIDLSRTYQDGRLRWIAHAEWVDGFFHQLPTGPPPSRNETAYLYRTIAVDQDVTLKAHIVTEDAIRVWLGGQVVGEAMR